MNSPGSPAATPSGKKKPKSTKFGFLRNLWAFSAFVGGYFVGSLGSEGKALQDMVSQVAGGAVPVVNTGDGSDDTSAGRSLSIPSSTSNSVRQGVDLLPWLKDCEKPQSPRTLQEMAAVYKPSKFYAYLHTNFDRFYPQYMEKYRTKHFRMLEIGLDTGQGSLLWEEYFPCAKLVGLEYNVGNTKNEGASKIQTIVGDQGNAEFLKTSFLEQSEGGNFDLIVDDGGHHYEQQRTSYEVLFEKALNPGGLYVMEDIETSYWKKGTGLYGSPVTRGGLAEPATIINQFKQLVDVVNKKFHDNTYTVFGPVDQLVSTVGFGSNVIFLEKKTREHCWNERPYVWPDRLVGPANQQPLDANKGSMIDKFCQGINMYVRDNKNKRHSG
ncbi:2''-O-methyltransferase [Seminavis robusta]|uniref:2''-O-methyltransferase n=1 Tax=Seminavis robusta TaxID=568900 RepID=A0A9N8H2W9_9STRA|nr:2''-O-methyltransferase [Seminavis robusta]|eukprot:Sro16_g011660.1 2''-O-methyltransferase (382) ;mRNA; r:63308-64453